MIFKFSYINVKLFSIYIFCKRELKFPKKICYIVFRKGYDTMIKRHIYNQILNSVKSKPVTLITGARQVGKSTLAFEFEKGFFLCVS